MGKVYLIPSVLHEDGYDSIPVSVREKIKACRVFYVENERTTRRFFRALDKSIVIDGYEWVLMDDQVATREQFKKDLKDGKNIGIVSEAGCPGVADPGQQLVAIAHQFQASIVPLAGPGSIIMALMASGMNGQQFRFHGYLPVDNTERKKAIRELEQEAIRKNCTQIFIETPYRNNQLTEAILQECQPGTRLCIAVDITAGTEWIKTARIDDWKKQPPDIHKRPAIFLIGAAMQ